MGDNVGALRCHDLTTSASKWDQWAHTGEVENVSWSPDHRLAASTSADGTLRLWNAKTGDPLRVFLPLDHDRAVLISAAGRLGADSRGLQDKFAYVFQVSSDAPIEFLPPGAFRQRFGKSFPEFLDEDRPLCR